jgi:glucose-1-phosphate cytidylyltransferase
MKVVLFCGGLGTRLREHSDTIPKPLVNVGSKPLLWNLMKYYAHYGHKEFILCLGYKGKMIKDYFLNYNTYMNQDFTMHGNSQRFEPAVSDISDWKIHFVNTGLHANIGSRLQKVKQYLDGDDMFLANYSDQLSDLDLDMHIKRFSATDAISSFVLVRPYQSFHHVDINKENYVERIESVSKSDFWINGGYMVFRSEIFDFMHEGEELVEEPFERLMKLRKLRAYQFEGFWHAMDTFKDKIKFDRMNGSGNKPWNVWGDA